MCFCNVIRDLSLLEATTTNSDAFPDNHSTLKFRYATTSLMFSKKEAGTFCSFY